MSRRHRAEKREVLPDPKFGNMVVPKFMNSIMYAGKKSVAETIVYGALDMIEGKTKQNPVTVFEQALDNVMPTIEVRSRRVGGATYQVPVEVRNDRRQALGIRWLIIAARERNEKTMTERLSAELLDASNNRGTRSRSAKTPIGWRRPIAPSRITGGEDATAGELSEESTHAPHRIPSKTTAISASWPTSMPGRRRRPSGFSITPARATRSAKSMRARPPWTGWSRSRSAASPSRRPRRLRSGMASG